MDNHESLAPGQQNFPKANKEENFSNALPGEQIIAGAQQEDQLDQFKKNVEGSNGDSDMPGSPTQDNSE